jgi:hypothetical protein
MLPMFRDGSRTWHHQTSRSSSHRVPNLWLTIPSPLHQVSYSCLDLHRCPPCRTCHMHTTRQANTILHTNKGNSVEPRKYPRFKFKHHHVNDSSQLNQETDHLVYLLLGEYIDNKKHKVWILNPKPHEAHLEDQEPKSLRRSSRRRKNRKGNKRHEKWQAKEVPKKNSKSNSSWIKLPLTLSMQALLLTLSPLDRYYHASFLNHPISRSSTNFVHILSPLSINSSNTNREKKDMLCMRSKLWCFTRYINKYLNNYTPSSYQDLQNKNESS